MNDFEVIPEDQRKSMFEATAPDHPYYQAKHYKYYGTMPGNSLIECPQGIHQTLTELFSAASYRCNSSMRWLKHGAGIFVYEAPTQFECNEEEGLLLETMPLSKDTAFDLEDAGAEEVLVFTQLSASDPTAGSWVHEDTALRFQGVFRLSKEDSLWHHRIALRQVACSITI